MKDLKPGQQVKILEDIVFPDGVAFHRGEEVEIEKVVPHSTRPEFKYVVYSKTLEKKFQLSDANIEEVPTKYSHVIERADAWSSRLKKCRFAGDINLSFDELTQAADDFVGFQSSLRTDADLYESCLVVLAVNCAYHLYDDSGFWPHFFELLETQNTIGNQTKYGDLIERRFGALGLLRVSRKGPFRYVGAILDQCGVSQRYVNSLARIARSMKDRLGWEDLLAISLKQFQSELSHEYCSTYLRQYLSDEGGWEFFIKICNQVMLFEQGFVTLQDLKELPGYQTDFWEQFLSGFEASLAADTKTVVVFKPRVMLYPDKLFIGLELPSPEYVQDVRTTTGILNAEYPVTKIDSDSSFSERYSGMVSVQGDVKSRWAITGWVPDGLPTVFDIRDGLLDRDSTVYPGEYYVVAPVNVELEIEKLDLLGALALREVEEYVAYRAMVQSGDVLKGYYVPSEEAAELHWISPDEFRLPYSSSFVDVFTGSIPDIEISNLTQIESNYVGAFYDLGIEKGRIKNKQDIENLRGHAARYAPVRGRVWLSSIARTRTIDTGRSISALEFVLLPRCEISYDEELYAFDDEVLVVVDKPADCEVFFEEAVAVEEDNFWLMPNAAIDVFGLLNSGDISTPITLPVWRTYVRSAEDGPVRYLSARGLANGSDGYEVVGIPNEEGVLSFIGAAAGKSISFDNRGVAPLPTNELLELFTGSDADIAEMQVCVDGGTAHSTKAIIIDEDKLKMALLGEAECNINATSADNIRTALELAELIKSGDSGDEIRLSQMPNLIDSEITDAVNALLACAQVFDEVKVTIGDEELDMTGMVSDDALKALLRNYSKYARTADVPEIVIDTEVLPGVERWRDSAVLLMSRGTTEYRLGLISDWSNQVLTKQIRSESQILRLPGGETIDRAWRCYTRNDERRALELAASIQEEPGLVQDLATILRAAIFLRNARFSESKAMLESWSAQTEMEPYTGVLLLISQMLDEDFTFGGTEFNSEIFGQIPLMPKDRKVFATVADITRGIDPTSEMEDMDDDWLHQFVVAVFQKGKSTVNEAARRLALHEDIIPASPQKGTIVGFLSEIGGLSSVN